MRLAALFLFSLLIFAWWTPAATQVNDPLSLEPMVLTDEQGEYPLGLHLEILEDPAGELTIEDVASPEYDSQFTPSQVEVPNYGFTDNAYWVRLHLRSEARVVNRWLLEVGFANMQFVDLYSPSQSGEGFAVKQAGSLRHASSRDIRYQRVVFELTPPVQSEQTYYLRFKNDASMTLLLTIWSPIAFLDHIQQDLLQYGLFFGVMLGLLGYNAFLLFSLREKSYLFLTLFLANMMFFEATYAGFLETFAFPDFYALKPFYMPISFSLIFVWTLLFSHSFLDVQARIPTLHRVMIAILAVWGVLDILVPFTSFIILARLMVPWGIVSLMVLLATGIISWRQGFRPARFFLIAWAGLAVTLILVMLVRLGTVASTGLTEDAYHAGIMWMAVCWSIALADRINLLKAETEEANRDLHESERRLSQILEGLPLAVVVYGKDQKPNFVNRRVTEILGNPVRGIEPDLTAGRTLAEAMRYYSFRVEGSDQEYPVERLPVYRALQGQPASADDAEADLIDRRVPLEIWATPVLDDAGDVEEAVVAFQDITARKDAEKARRASEKRFRAVVENAFDGIVFMAHDRQVLYVSPSYGRLSGLNVKEVIGQSGVTFVHPDDRARIAQVFGELLQKPGSRTTVEYRSKRQDGSWIWVETNAVNLLHDPSVGAVVLNVRDITERKQSEAALTEYRLHLERLVEERTVELSDSNEQLRREVSEREKLEQLLYQHIQWLTALHKVRQVTGGTTDLPQAYDQLIATILHSQSAIAVFLIYWGYKDGHVESICRLKRDDSILDLEGVASIFKKESSLRQEVELGKPIPYSADQATSLPAPIGELFREDGCQSLILMPLTVRQSIGGVLGIAQTEPVQVLSSPEIEFVVTMAHDLSELAHDTELVDQARALVAAEERNRLARDLHDSVTQVLFSASLVAEVLPQIWRRDPNRALESVEELRQLTRGAMAEMRTMLLELRPASVLKTPLPDLLGQLTEAVTSRVGLPFELSVQRIPALPEDVHTGFYRIAQEALNNVVKHAQASHVIVTLSVRPLAPDSSVNARHEVKLAIEDDGVGFSPRDKRQEHLGMGIMRERADAIQATLSVESRPGAGTQVVLTWRGELKDSS